MSEEIKKPGKPGKRLHPILSDEDVLAARARAREKVTADQKALALKKVEDEEVTRLKIEEGLVVGGVEDEMVNVTIDLPEFADAIRINMRPHWHGCTYTVPRHVARGITWMMQQAWHHQLLQIDGKKLRDTYYRNAALGLGQRETRIGAMGAHNAPPLSLA